jgi:hypothetical protein
MKTDNYVKANTLESDENLPKPGQDEQIGVESLGSGSFTKYWTWRANGVHRKVAFYDKSINGNSRVFVSISEFDSNAEVNRFVGDARMAVYNVSPFNGGFLAWVEVAWNSPLNLRFDVLVDP